MEQSVDLTTCVGNSLYVIDSITTTSYAEPDLSSEHISSAITPEKATHASGEGLDKEASVLRNFPEILLQVPWRWLPHQGAGQGPPALPRWKQRPPPAILPRRPTTRTAAQLHVSASRCNKVLPGLGMIDSNEQARQSKCAAPRTQASRRCGWRRPINGNKVAVINGRGVRRLMCTQVSSQCASPIPVSEIAPTSSDSHSPINSVDDVEPCHQDAHSTLSDIMSVPSDAESPPNSVILDMRRGCRHLSSPVDTANVPLPQQGN